MDAGARGLARGGAPVNITDDAQLCVENLVPSGILQQVVDRAYFLNEVARYVAMDDDALLRMTEVCLRNLERIDVQLKCDLGPDVRIRHVLVPELWERLRPGARDALRRILTSLPEYAPDPDRHSFWRRSRLWSASHEGRLQKATARLREDATRTAGIAVGALIEQTRFAITGACATEEWLPDYPVYEPRFTYRLVPAIAWRVLVRTRRDAVTA